MTTGHYSFKDSPLSRFTDTSDSKVQETLYYSAYGIPELNITPTQYWAKSVMKDTFTRDDDEFDFRSWSLLDDMAQPKTVQANHRGDGKTTRSGAYILRAICMRQVDMLLYLQATYDDAATEMDNVKTEMLTNDFITEAFGLMKATSFDDVKKTFGKRAWFACNPQHPKIPRDKWGEPFAFVLPRGAGQRVRGRNMFINGKRIRPRLVIADDLEDDTLVLEEENRNKLRKWFFGSLMPVVPQDVFPNPKSGRWDKPRDADWDWQPPYRVLVNGTILHHDALIPNLMSASDWKHVSTPLGGVREDENGKIVYFSLRKRITDAQLTREAESAKQTRTLDTFYREKLCIPTAREYQCWTDALFQYCTHEKDEEIQTSDEYVRFMIVDPSKSASQQADLTGIIAAAVNPRTNAIYIRRAVAEHLKSSDVAKRALEIAAKTNTQMVFVEIIGQHGVTDENFMNQITKRGLPIQLFLLNQGHTPKGDYGTGKDAIKRWRGQQILPYYQDGEVYHHPDLKGGALEMHMKDYPNPTDWCFIDCCGYIPAAMRELGVTFAKVEKWKNVEQFPVHHNHSRMDRDIANGAWRAV